MAANKTVPNGASVDAFIDAVEDERKHADSHELIELMRTITGHEPKLWGSSLVGFDSYHYRYASGHAPRAVPAAAPMKKPGPGPGFFVLAAAGYGRVSQSSSASRAGVYS